MNSLYKILSRRSSALLTLLLATTLYGTATNAEQENALAKPTNVLGEAFRQGSDQLLYRELHEYAIDSNGELEHQVTYTQPDGSAWAEKQIRYHDRATAPDFELTDSLNRESLKVTVTESIIKVAHTQTDKTQEHQLDSKSPLVVDAGFDPFVRQHWQSLSHGNSETFFFLLPRREKLVELRLTPQSCSDFEPDHYLCLALEINNWLLRMLVDPIELTYQRDERCLIRYLGVSNLSFPGEEDSPQVDIRYRPVTDTATH